MRTSILNFLVLISFLFGSCSKDEVADSSKTTTTTNGTAATYTNVAYASTSTVQTIDIYLPSGTGPFPVVVIIHGGAFMMGRKSDKSANCDAVTAKGYVEASINYRLSVETKSSQIKDIKADFLSNLPYISISYSPRFKGYLPYSRTRFTI